MDEPLEIRGGIGGVVAEYEDLRSLRSEFEALAGTLRDWAGTDADEAADADLVASSVLSPDSFAAAERAILGATLGPHGLAGAVVALTAAEVATRAVQLFYAAADESSRWAGEALLSRAGWQFEQALPGLGLAGLLTGVLAPGVTRSMREVLQTHPGLVQSASALLPGMLAGARLDPRLRIGILAGERWGPDSMTGVLVDASDGIYGPDRHGALDPDQSREMLELPVPTGVESLVKGTDRVASGLASGGFAIQRIQRSDGTTSWVVQLPGTDVDDSDSVRDWTGNIHLLEGRDTAYGEAIDKALVNAGAGRDDPILLSGHSAGGMQAAHLAGDPNFRWNVKGVLTAAAPIGGLQLPDTVAALSLENTRDLVVGLDGHANEEGVGHVTVRADAGGDGLSQAHSLSDRYVPLAGAVDAGADPSTTQIIDAWRDNGFVSTGSGESSKTFSYRAIFE